ncbi:MAG: hypothetical protein QW652_07830 [Candidatus Nitrosotenuis sp.]
MIPFRLRNLFPKFFEKEMIRVISNSLEIALIFWIKQIDFISYGNKLL